MNDIQYKVNWIVGQYEPIKTTWKIFTRTKKYLLIFNKREYVIESEQTGIQLIYQDREAANDSLRLLRSLAR